MAIEFLRMESTHGNNAKLNDYVERNGQYEKKDDIIAKGFGNLPSWAKDSHDFWLACDQFQKQSEKSENTKPKKDLKIKDETGKHIIIALPKEFDNSELADLGQKLAEKIAGNNHAYTYGIHVNTGVLSNEKNPHLHIFMSNRKIEPKRPEPNRETYFKKSRTLKTGEITGGYRKDVDMTGTNRTEWLKLKKQEFETLCNAAILEHNQRTGEKVSKIDFKSREGKGSKHIGNVDIAYAIKANKPVKKIQKELDRRIEAEIDKQGRIIREAENESIREVTNLGFIDRLAVQVVPFIQNPTNAAKRAVKRENMEIKKRRDKLPQSLSKKIEEERQKNTKKGEEAVLFKQDQFNAGLKKEAENRGIKRDYDYHASNKAVQQCENERNEAIAEAKRKAEEAKKKAERDAFLEKYEREEQKKRESIQRNPLQMANTDKFSFISALLEREKIKTRINIDAINDTDFHRIQDAFFVTVQQLRGNREKAHERMLALLKKYEILEQKEEQKQEKTEEPRKEEKQEQTKITTKANKKERKNRDFSR